MLIVTQMINHFQEALLPLVVKTSYSKVGGEIKAPFSVLHTIYDGASFQDKYFFFSFYI